MTKRTLIGMLVCLAVLITAGGAWAQDADPGGRWWRDPGVSRELNLNDRERRSLDRLYMKNRDALIDRKADLEKERSRLADVMEREPFDEAAAKAQLRKVEECSSGSPRSGCGTSSRCARSWGPTVPHPGGQGHETEGPQTGSATRKQPRPAGGVAREEVRREEEAPVRDAAAATGPKPEGAPR